MWTLQACLILLGFVENVRPSAFLAYYLSVVRKNG